MKATLKYYYVSSKNGTNISVDSYVNRIELSSVLPGRWDGKLQQELEGERLEFSMSSEDARELAEMLLKAADHTDELDRQTRVDEMSLTKSKRY